MPKKPIAPPVLHNLFDTHFHLTADDDPGELVTKAREAGVSRLLVAGAKVGDERDMITRIEALPNVFAAVGVHPHEAEKFANNAADFETLLASSRVRAIGEVGMDQFYDFAPVDQQRAVFETFLGLAVRHNLPVVIHSRDAYAETLAAIEAILPDQHPFVIHCCTAPPEWAERFLARGGWLSFTGIATFKKSDEVREVMAMTPPDRLMFETDSPYLAPMPYRGRRNQPAFLPFIVDFAANFLNEDAQELADRTTANACRFFNVEA